MLSGVLSGMLTTSPPNLSMWLDRPLSLVDKPCVPRRRWKPVYVVRLRENGVRETVPRRRVCSVLRSERPRAPPSPHGFNSRKNRERVWV